MLCALSKAWVALLLARTPGDNSRIVGELEVSVAADLYERIIANARFEQRPFRNVHWPVITN
jgi:hypothetical protein